MAAVRHRRGVVLPSPRVWPRRRLLAAHALLLGGLLLGWQLGARVGLIDPFFWSTPAQIARTAVVFVRDGTALQDTWYTARATLVGFAAGSALGAALGLSLWWSANAARMVEPYIVVFNAVPKMALGPLIILVFGIGIGSKIAMAIALTSVITAVAAHAGVRAVDPDLVRLAYSLGGRRWDVFAKIVVPSALPWVVSSLRINIGLALAGVIVGEFISSRFGLGKVIMYAGSTYDMALTWVGIGVLSLLSMLLYGAVVAVERRLLRDVGGTSP